MKLIHFYLNDATGPFCGKTDHACYTTIRCDQSENCGFYKKGQCAKLNAFGSCPYGEYRQVKGPTRRARSYHKFLSDVRERFRDSPRCDQATDVFQLVGDFAYLPLNYLRNYVNPIDAPIVHKKFILISNLTPELVVALVRYRPKSLYGGEIQNHQERDLPIFIRGLQESMPELLRAAAAIEPTIDFIITKLTSVGRHAVLETIKPGVGLLVDIHGGHWTWDGVYLTSKDSHMAFGIVHQISEIRLVPIPGQLVKITDDGQVLETTIFTD